MTALGIGCSDCEPVTIFVNKPRQYSRLEVEYFEACDKSRELWKMWNAMIDSQVDQDLIAEKLDECERQDKLVLSMKRQIQCKHDMAPIGGQQFIGGGVFDNEDDICNLCGALGSKLIKKTINYGRVK